MHVYRIGSSKFIHDIHGTGGLYHSGRWHNAGTPILYTAGSLSLAKLEVLANSLITPVDQALLILDIPDDISHKIIKIEDLPENWNVYPAPTDLTVLTAEWIKENRYLVMRVPSAQSELEFNYLINPKHPDHHRLEIIEIKPHKFDPRLKGR